MSRFRIEEAKMYDAADQCSGISNGMGGAYDNMGGSFIGMKSAGMFTQGFADIQGQIGSLGTSIGQVSKMVNEHTDSIRGLDEQGVKEVEQILVPQDFVANNSMQINEFNKSILEKIDGKHVDSNAAEGQVEGVGESIVKKVQTLDDVTTAATQKQNYDERVSISKEQELANISNPNGTDEQHINESTNIAGQEKLANINNGEGLANQKIDESTVLRSVGLGNISKQDAVSKQAVDATYAGVGNASLGQVSTGGPTKKVELEEKKKE